MHSVSLLFYQVQSEHFSALQKIGKMSTPPSYDKLVAEVGGLTSEVSTVQHQV